MAQPSLPRPLDGRHAAVTGGGRGIGAAIATALAHAGARVTVMGRAEAPLRAMAESLPVARVVACDVTDGAAVEAAFADAAAGLGPVDILVNNAGAAVSRPFHKQSEADLQAMLDVNLLSVWRCAQAVLPGMRAQGWGRVVTVASTAGLKGYRYVAGYVAAKHAAVGLTRALALELAGSGVTVNAVCPGFTETDMAQSAIDAIAAKTGRGADAARDALARTNPMGRLVAPAEVADATLWLCGPGADAMNGAVIPVDGGEMAG